MARTNNLTNFLTDVATAIKTKKGNDTPIPASDFDTEIIDLPSGGGLDWSAIGYSGEPESIIDDYNYSKSIYDNWDATQTSLQYKFTSDYSLVYMPLVDTSNVTIFYGTFSYCKNLVTMPLVDTSSATSMNGLFQNCERLASIPLFNTSNVTDMQNMFRYCYEMVDIPKLNTSKVTFFNNMVTSCTKLSDQSLDNILQMCIGATVYTGIKTLVRLGFQSASYPASRIQALPHYQDFIDAGWTIGY